MSNLVTRLRALKLEFSYQILVHLIMISLHVHFFPFKINYNTQREKWTLNELIAHCMQEDERLKQEMFGTPSLCKRLSGDPWYHGCQPYDNTQDLNRVIRRSTFARKCTWKEKIYGL